MLRASDPKPRTFPGKEARMGKASWRILVLAALGVLGCDNSRAPRMAVPTNSTNSADPKANPDTGPIALSSLPVKTRYQGRSPEEWGQVLASEDLNQARQAALALKILRAEGRPYLVKGLESPLPETRRLCLECLTVSDLRCYGDQGRKALVKLAGDRMDMRIRERATQYLKEWDRSIPAP
jgi:hypothetical protein